MKGLIGYKMVEIQKKHFNYPVNPFIFDRVDHFTLFCKLFSDHICYFHTNKSGHNPLNF